MEDGVSGGLQHRHMMCCKKGGRRGRWACRVQRWHHRGDVVFRIGGLAYDTNIFSRVLLKSSNTFHVLVQSQNIVLFVLLFLRLLLL